MTDTTKIPSAVAENIGEIRAKLSDYCVRESIRAKAILEEASAMPPDLQEPMLALAEAVARKICAVEYELFCLGRYAGAWDKRVNDV